MSSPDDDVVDTSPHYVDIVHDSGLPFYYPNYSYVDFTCDISDPNKDTTIIFACAATFNGTDHNNGPHLLVAQNHVCSGVKWKKRSMLGQKSGK